MILQRVVTLMVIPVAITIKGQLSVRVQPQAQPVLELLLLQQLVQLLQQMLEPEQQL